MKKHNCEKCKFRAVHDNNPASFLGRLWRWHINWCPGWNKYYKSLDDDSKKDLSEKYQFIR